MLLSDSAGNRTFCRHSINNRAESDTRRAYVATLDLDSLSTAALPYPWHSIANTAAAVTQQHIVSTTLV